MSTPAGPASRPAPPRPRSTGATAGWPGEDWRLGEVEGWSPRLPGGVVLTLDHVEDERQGEAHVDPHTGRVHLVDLPGVLRWQLTHVGDNPDVTAWPTARWFAGCRGTDT